MSAAINLLIWSGPSESAVKPIGAKWHIWPSSELTTVKAFIQATGEARYQQRKVGEEDIAVDFVSSGAIIALEPRDIDQLAHPVVEFVQGVGDLVYIPAHCEKTITPIAGRQWTDIGG